MGRSCGLAAVVVMLGCEGLQTAVAEGDTRTISMHHIHTDENITITYKRNGRYDEDALKKINWFLRDWRRGESITMDPKLLDIVWEVSREVGAKTPIEVVCGYRSPATNAMLRRRSSGVAKFSQHMLGHAMDFFIPGAALEDLRYAGLRLQRGGVGYYPTSGSPFVHLDSGNVRHWPRLPEAQLARILSGAPKVQVADAAPKFRNPFAALFGAKDADEAEDESTATPAAATGSVGARTVVAAADTRPAPIAVVPLPVARRAPPAAAAQPKTAELASVSPASATARPAVPAQVLAALDPATASTALDGAPASANAVIASRGYWDTAAGGLRQLDQTAAKVASADALLAVAPKDVLPRVDGASGQPQPVAAVTLAYAPPAPAAPRPVAATQVPAPAPATDVSAAAKRSAAQAALLPAAVRSAAVNGTASAKFDDVWLRAVMLAPDLQYFMSASILGAPDFKDLRTLMRKPTSTLAMRFSDDPMAGVAADHFSGDAIVFLNTVSFVTRTAFLQQ